MTGKITAAVVAAILLGSAGAASAQIGRTGPTYSPYYNSYYNRNYWEGVAPAGRIYQRDLSKQVRQLGDIGRCRSRGK
jgi:hypothetical protein